MDNASTGKIIEAMIISKYNLKKGFCGIDACQKNRPVEIKACRYNHKNGIYYKNTERITQGRFWINSFNHDWLSNNNGFYIFVLYDLLDGIISIIDHKKVSCEMVNKFYHTNSFKIGWQRVFR